MEIEEIFGKHAPKNLNLNVSIFLSAKKDSLTKALQVSKISL